VSSLPLIIMQSGEFAKAGVGTLATLALVLAFSLLSCVLIAAPVGVVLVAGDRASGVLESTRRWLIRNNYVIMGVLFLVLGLKFLGDGIGSLLG